MLCAKGIKFNEENSEEEENDERQPEPNSQSLLIVHRSPFRVVLTIRDLTG